MSSSQLRQCPVCSQQFSRNEHLQRHRLTHYEHNNRHFQCKICFESFSRSSHSDVLKRHELSQHPPGNDSQVFGSRKSRATVACDRCAKAKLRCDGMSPCGRCKSKALNCTIHRPHSVLKRRYPFLPPKKLTLMSGDCGTEAEANQETAGAELIRSLDIPVSRALYPGTVSTPNVNGDQVTGEMGDSQTHFNLSLHDEVRANARKGENSIRELPLGVSMVSDTTFAHAHGYQVTGDNDLVEPGLDLDNSSLDFSNADNIHLFDSMGSSFGFDFPNDSWFQVQSPSFPTSIDTEPSSGQRRLKPAPPTKHGTSPYASCPLSHSLENESRPLVNLENLQICTFLQDRACWKQIHEISAKQWSQDGRTIPAINEQTRDALVAITHITLSNALESTQIRSFPLKFPPLETIQCLFRSCMTRFARLYPMIHPKTFEMAIGDEHEGSTYPIFLQNVIILGAMLLSSREVQAFGMELAYLVRKAMNDIMAKDVRTTDDVWILSSTILITATGAWSGDKTHVELAEACRGSYTVMFNRRGYLKPHPENISNNEAGSEWLKWIVRERKRRLCHVWYIVEQEISFFDSITSHISFTDMRSQMPGPDNEFYAETEAEWRAIREAVNKNSRESKTVRASSLAALYWLFTRDDFLHLDVEITPLQLRLLQCAIQTQILQQSQSSRFVNIEEAFVGIPPGTLISSRSTASSQLKIEELQNLLVRWYIISKRLFTFENASEAAVACYLMHHLISMELYICFNDIQCLAGKDGLKVGRALIPQFQQWARSPSALKAISHAGQIIKILQTSTPCKNHTFLRPIWWPLALTRAALVLWSYAIANHITARESTGLNGQNTDTTNFIPINSMFEDSGPYGKVLQLGEGEPCVIDLTGSQIPIMDISDILDLVLAILEDGASRSTPLCASIQHFICDIQRCGIPY